MKYKLMIIDDSMKVREENYLEVFPASNYDILLVRSYSELIKIFSKTSVDGYVVDVVLDGGDWKEIGNAGNLFSKLPPPPRRAPIILVSMNWGERIAIDVLNVIKRNRDIDVLRYFTWQEFEHAISNKSNRELEFLQNNVLVDLDVWHEKSTFRPDDDQGINILVLADLQYSDPASSPYSNFSEQWVANALRRDNRIPDLIVFAGDIAYSGDTGDYKVAKERLESGLLKELWGSQLESRRERVLLVPGNHDVNLRYLACRQFIWNRDEKRWMQLSKEDVVIKDESFSLEPFRQFAVEMSGTRQWYSRPSASHVDRRFEACGLRFFLLNTTLGSSIEKQKHVEFPVDELEKINTSLGSEDRPEDYFNIVVSHHGVVTGGNQTEQVSNWNEVGKQFFAFQQIGMWIFGHYHTKDLNKIQGGVGTINLIQAPTLRVIPEEGTSRGFTLINLKRQAGKVVDGDVCFYKFIDNGVSSEEPECKALDIIRKHK